MLLRSRITRTGPSSWSGGSSPPTIHIQIARAGFGLLRTYGEDGLTWRAQVGAVEDVEELRAELEPDTLVDLRGLGKRQVQIVVAGTGERIAAQVADRAVGGRGEGVGVEELRGLLGGAATGVELAGEVGVDVGADGVAAVA